MAKTLGLLGISDFQPSSRLRMDQWGRMGDLTGTKEPTLDMDHALDTHPMHVLALQAPQEALFCKLKHLKYRFIEKIQWRTMV